MFPVIIWAGTLLLTIIVMVMEDLQQWTNAGAGLAASGLFKYTIPLSHLHLHHASK